MQLIRKCQFNTNNTALDYPECTPLDLYFKLLLSWRHYSAPKCARQKQLHVKSSYTR